MKQLHVECKPDEALVKKLGFTRKAVVHHSGKSRVFHKLEFVKNQLAMVDEDPGSAKTNYEKNLIFIEELHGIKMYSDKSKNKVLILEGKLEDWIVKLCKKSGVSLAKFGLPEKPNELHSVIIQRIIQYESLIDHLLEIKCWELNQLKKWLS